MIQRSASQSGGSVVLISSSERCGISKQVGAQIVHPKSTPEGNLKLYMSDILTNLDPQMIPDCDKNLTYTYVWKSIYYFRAMRDLLAFRNRSAL